jgi:hypothetical protein
MHYSIRTLKKTGRPDTATSSTPGTRGAGLAALGAQYLAAVYDVEATELSLSREEILQRLREGVLQSSDLIFAHDRWGTLLEHEDFGEVAQARGRIEAVRRTTRQVLTWLLFASPFFLAAVHRFWLVHQRFAH